MLDLEHQTIYDIIRTLAGEDDVYKVVEADEITERLPAGMSVSKVQLSSVIRDLKDRDYIQVKYFTPDEYCLLIVKRIEDRITSLPSVQDDMQKPAERTLYGEQKKKDQKQTVSVGSWKIFFAAFLGALLGGIVTMITALIVKLI